jgi:DNA-binding CsgD family transcriptional regulator
MNREPCASERRPVAAAPVTEVGSYAMTGREACAQPGIYAPAPAHVVTLVVAASGAIISHTADPEGLLARLPESILAAEPDGHGSWRAGARVLQIEHRAHLKGDCDGPDLDLSLPVGDNLVKVAVRPCAGTARQPDAGAGLPAFLLIVSRHEPVETSAVGKLMAAGASRTQSIVGGAIVAGFSKAEIAARAGVKVSSVEDATRKLYQRLDLHSAQELAAWTFGVKGR